MDKIRFGEKAKNFRKLINGNRLVLRPCAYDTLSAILIERAGFQVCGTSGYAISGANIGQPDVGLLSFGGMFDQVRRIINSTSLPVDVDADTGYGDSQNVYWTVQSYIKVDAAGIRIEDQTWPKQCGHMSGCKMITTDEMVAKIRMADLARDELGSDLVIGARTDARSIEGIDKTIERAEAYANAGADYIYVECPASQVEVLKLVGKISAPIAFNIIPGGRTPMFNLQSLEDWGVRYVSVPMVCLYPAAKAMQDALVALKDNNLYEMSKLGVSWKEFNDLVGKPRWDELKEKVK